MNEEEKRFHAAVAAMQGLLSTETGYGVSFELTAKDAIQHADALLAELDRTTVKQPLTVQPDDDGWIAHIPGDPMPCDGEMEVRIRCADGYECGGTAEFWSGSHDDIDLWTGEGSDDPESRIIAWKPA